MNVETVGDVPAGAEWLPARESKETRMAATAREGTTPSTASVELPVVVIGAGPNGLTAAALLARAARTCGKDPIGLFI